MAKASDSINELVYKSFRPDLDVLLWLAFRDADSDLEAARYINNAILKDANPDSSILSTKNLIKYTAILVRKQYEQFNKLNVVIREASTKLKEASTKMLPIISASGSDKSSLERNEEFQKLLNNARLMKSILDEADPTLTKENDRLETFKTIWECMKLGWTPLHYAASASCTESAKLLIDSGADIDSRAIRSQEFLDKESVSLNQALFLLLNKPLLDSFDYNFAVTPMKMACENATSEMVILLTKHGALIDNQSATALNERFAGPDGSFGELEEILCQLLDIIRSRNKDSAEADSTKSAAYLASSSASSDDTEYYSLDTARIAAQSFSYIKTINKNLYKTKDGFLNIELSLTLRAKIDSMPSDVIEFIKEQVSAQSAEIKAKTDRHKESEKLLDSLPEFSLPESDIPEDQPGDIDSMIPAATLGGESLDNILKILGGEDASS
jgi:hypothetical protein